ncbi:MAG: T9SS type A sorting domain-containing protein, partial [Hymenobacter sp.]
MTKTLLAHSAAGLTRAPIGLRRLLALLALVLGSSTGAWAQLAGTKTIGTDYPTLAAAIAALNAQGVGAGGVTFNVPAGYTETFASATAGSITLSSTSASPSTTANQVVFQKSGSGANPLITAGPGTTAALDAIISLSGTDYVTFDGIDLTENSANANTTTQAEYGYAFFRPSATDGCQNNTIRNCVVTLNKTNPASIGIAGLSNSAGSATAAVAATSAAGANSGNRLYGNVVTNSLTGINFAAASTTATTYYDQNNEIGSTVSGTVVGNTIGNFGGASAGWGAGGSYQNGLKVVGNTLNSTLNYTSATASTPVAASTVTNTLYGINCGLGTSANLDITSNTLTLASGGTTSSLYGLYNTTGSTPASNTVNITNNTLALTYTTATSASVYAYYNTGSPATLNVTGNSLTNTNLSNTGTTYLLYNSQSATAANVLNNTFNGITRTNTTGSLYCYYNLGSGTGTQTLTGNTWANITSATSGSFYGIYSGTSASESQQWSNNQLTNITSTGASFTYGLYCTYGSAASQIYNNTVTGITSGSTIYGIYLGNSSFAQVAAYGNTVGALSTSGASSSVYGMYTSVTTANLYRNKLYNLSAAGAGGLVYGIYTGGGTTITLYNNLIGNLTASTATSLNAVSGLYLSSGTTINAYYNTISLSGSSSGATFGTSGIYFSTTPTSVDLRNNIVVNTSVAAGAGGYTAALRRSSGTAGTVPTNYATTSNNNLLFADSPSATNVLYVEGVSATTSVNVQQTLTDFKGFFGNRDQASVSERPSFLSRTGTSTTFLHLDPTVATQAESAGTPIAGITTDYDGDTRNASTPDIGADEGTFIASDVTAPAITYTPLGNTASTTNRTLVATITDASGVATGTGAPRIYYRSGTSGAFVSAVATSVSGSAYTFTINYASIGGTPAAGTTVQYYIAAQDALGNAGTSPAGGAGTSPPGSTAPATPNQYLIQPVLSGTYYVTASVGTSPAPTKEFATLTAAANAYNTSGLGAAVSFVLLDASYSTAETFPITFNANGDASATNTLTIKPGAGVNAVVSGSVGTGALLKLSGADYVTIDGSNNGTTSRNLTLTNTSATTAGNAVVWLASASATDGATSNVLKNSIITGSALLAPQMGVFVGGSATIGTTAVPLAANSNNTLQNNLIYKAAYGVYEYGISAGTPDQGTAITGNKLGQDATNGLGIAGVQLTYANAVSIANNEVSYVSYGSSTSYGIYLSTGTSNVTVNANNVHDITYTGTGGYGGHGIQVSSGIASSNIVITNNFVSAISGDGYTSLSISSPVGIYLSAVATGGVRVQYNSVNLTGTSARTSSIITAALGVETGPTGLTVQNNIFYNAYTNSATATSKAYALYSSAAASAYTALNYNDYFVSGTQGVLGYFGAADRATLTDLRTATSQDANSVSLDPGFTSATDLHVFSSTLAVGTPLASVTTDYDGDTRSTTAPYLGADEVLPVAVDAQPLALTAPAASTGISCYSSAEVVTVTVRNSSITTALSFATNPLTVTVAVTGAVTQTFTTTVSTNAGNPGGTALASGASVSITLPGTLNMTTAGVYNFAVTASVTGDQNTGNNVLATQTRTVVAPALTSVSASTTSICGTSGAVTLTATGVVGGTVTWYSSADNYVTAIGTGSPLVLSTVSATTSYRARVVCGANVSANSSVLTVTVTNPLVTANNGPVARCGPGTVTLTATPSTGATINWYDSATATAPVATGNSFTTNVNFSTEFYAEASTGGSETVGPTTQTSTSTLTPQTGGALYFTTTSAVTIQAVTVYLAAGQAAGTVTIALRTGSSTTGAVVNSQSTAFPVPANATSAVASYVLPLNYSVPAAGQYTLHLVSATQSGLLRDDSGANTTGYPYNSSSGNVSITGTSVTGYYYYFYNWQVSGTCAGGRTAVQVTVNPVPATPTLTATGTSATGITLTSSATTGNQFYLNGVLIPGATGQTYLVNSGTRNGQYTVVTTNATGCSSAASAAVNVTVTAATAPLAGTSFRAYPNPTPSGQVTLELTGFRRATQLTVLDALGRVVASESLPANSGTATHTLDLRGVATGVYLLRLSNADGV